MKQKIYFLCALLFSIASFAQTFSFEGLNYNVTGLSTVEVGLNPTASGDFIIPRTVTNGDNGISYTVTSISNDAFSGCFNLTTVFIHDSVVKIGDYAFYNCTSLVNVSIPNSVKDIGNYTFASCIGLTFVSIPNSVTEIGVSAFENCTSLASVTIYDGLTEINALSFAGCTALPNLTIPNSIKSIGVSAFENCTSLNNITIPESVSKIGSSAFQGCIALTDIIIPSSVTIIDKETFQECTSLKNVIIPESITKIERRAFDQCTSLASINIPSSVTSIIENAFSLCTGLKNITVNWETPLVVNLNIFNKTAIKDVALIVPNGKKDIYKETAVWKDFNPIVEPFVAPFTGQTFETGGINYIVTKATSPFEVAVGNNRDFVGAAVIPENVNNYWNSFKVTSVSVEAFLKNSSSNGSLTSISLPNSVKSISNSAFYNCNLLTTLIFPPILESIGQDALNGCSSLTSLDLPSSLTSIADRAFFGCIGLQFVKVNWNIPLPINANVFGDVSLNNLELRIPIRTKDAYQAASVWRNFGTFSVPNAIKPGNGTLFTVNGINYIVTKDEAPYEVAIANNQEYSGDAVIPDLLNFEDNDFIVTSISVEAFNAYDTGARLTSIRLPNSITTINEKAFYYAFYLKSINLPSNLAYIGRDAFSYCGLSSINIPSTVNYIGDLVFDNCGLLSSITVNWISPYDLLNGYVFDGLNLSDVNLIVPSGTLTVYKNAPVWGNFKTITEIDSLPVIGQKIIEEGVTYIITKNTLPYEVAVGNSTTSSAKVSDSSKNQKSSNISGALIIPSTIVSEDKTFIVTSIIPNGFINNIGITSVTIPKTIKSIGNDAFTNCTGIKFVNLDWATPLAINPTVFGNVNLGNVRLNVPPGKASVYDATPVWTDFNPIVAPAVPVLGQTFTFEGINYNITSTTAPFTVEVGANGDTNLSDGIVAGFVGHANILSSVENGGISYTVTSIKFNAFYASHNLTSVTIPNTVTTIGFSAFRYTGLTSVTIPNSVTSIGIAAFGDCSQLTSVDISNSVTSIGASAFVGCTKLLTINIPSSVNSIESRAFYNCTALTTVNVNWTAPLPIDTSVFENVTLSNVTLNAPADKVTLYQAADVWKNFSIKLPVPATHLNFDGIDDYVVLPLNNTMIPSSNFTHEFWFQTTDSNGTLFTASTGAYSNPSGWDRSIYMDNGKVSTHLWTGAVNKLTSTASYNDGSWHHVAHVVNATGSYLYLDGLLAGSNAVTASAFTSNTEITLGVSPLAGGSYFNGNIDDVRIWNVSKTATEIARSKNCELLGNETGLVAYYKFNQGYDAESNSTLTTVTNATANANHGTLTGFGLAGNTSNFSAGSVVTSGLTLPNAPIATPISFCGASTVANLSPAPSPTINWYNVATGGTLLPGLTPISTSGTYYVAALNSNGCESARTSVAVTINSNAAPTASAQSFCNAATVANLTATGANLKWYDAATAGTLLNASAALATGTYFVSQTLNSCESERTAVAVTVNTTLAPIANQSGAANGDINVNINTPSCSVMSGLYTNDGIVNGKNSYRGTTENPTLRILFNGSKWVLRYLNSTTEYENTTVPSGLFPPIVGWTINGGNAWGCTGTMTIDLPQSSTAVCAGATIANLTATGTDLKWYSTETGGTTLETTTALATGTYYVSQSLNSCESARTSVAVAVNTTAARSE
jgi:hypothetical protein